MGNQPIFDAGAWYIWYYWDNFKNNYRVADKGMRVLQRESNKLQNSLYDRARFANSSFYRNFTITPETKKFLSKCFNSNDILLEEIYQGLANSLNEYFASDKLLMNYNKNYQNISTKSSMVKFFEAIKETLEAIGEAEHKQIDLTPFDDLAEVFCGRKTKSEIASYAEQDLEVANNIYQSLYQLKSFNEINAGHILEIFGRQLGEAVAAAAWKNIPEDVYTIAKDYLVSLPFKSNSNIKVITTGTDKTTDNKTAKPDISVQDGEIYSIQLKEKSHSKGDLFYIGSLELNSSVKWHKGKNTKIKIVDTTPLTNYLSQFDSQIQYYAYNFISFKNREKDSLVKQGYNETRRIIALSFVDEWLSGSGKLLQNTGLVDKAQFLMINGKLYPMMTVIRALCNSYEEKSTGALGMSFQNIGRVNSPWQEPKRSDNLQKWERSKITNQLINDIKIISHLDLNKLGL